MSSEKKVQLCEYFNKQGHPILRIAVVDSEAVEAPQSAIELAGKKTTPEEGAVALQALIHEVIDERLSIHLAREITSLRVNHRKAVKIEAILPALEQTFGANAACWARGIFPRLGPASGIQ